uniref:Reverse transcriptase zinc-binding domain-containing protein n=1 Tax=Arundo donax TaxID=35708 RepID=A0A0A8ZJQ5_ARUDO
MAVSGFELQEGEADRHIWTPASSGVYSAKSAYQHLFAGSIPFDLYTRTWKAWAPLRCKIFIWLATLNRC